MTHLSSGSNSPSASLRQKKLTLKAIHSAISSHSSNHYLLRRHSPFYHSNNMSSNVGLSTPRGSGTSGHVQRNLSVLHPNKKPTNRFAPYPSSRDDIDLLRHKQRQPDQKILAHDRAREIEVKVFELRDKLEDADVEEEEIERRCEELRASLEKQNNGNAGARDGRGLKRYQVHELAAAKIEESEKLRRALGIRKDYEEGSHWNKGAAATDDRLKKGLREDDERKRGEASPERIDREDDDDSEDGSR